MKYPHNVLEGFGNGALLDLRVRFAMRLLEGPAGAAIILASASDHIGNPDGAATVAANFTLNLSEYLLAGAEERGWIDPLPDLPTIDGALIDQAKRTAEFQARQQVHGNAVANKIMSDDAPKVIPMAGGKH